MPLFGIRSQHLLRQLGWKNKMQRDVCFALHLRFVLGTPDEALSGCLLRKKKRNVIYILRYILNSNLRLPVNVFNIQKGPASLAVNWAARCCCGCAPVSSCHSLIRLSVAADFAMTRLCVGMSAWDMMNETHTVWNGNFRRQRNFGRGTRSWESKANFGNITTGQ